MLNLLVMVALLVMKVVNLTTQGGDVGQRLEQQKNRITALEENWNEVKTSGSASSLEEVEEMKDYIAQLEERLLAQSTQQDALLGQSVASSPLPELPSSLDVSSAPPIDSLPSTSFQETQINTLVQQISAHLEKQQRVAKVVSISEDGSLVLLEPLPNMALLEQDEVIVIREVQGSVEPVAQLLIARVDDSGLVVADVLPELPAGFNGELKVDQLVVFSP